MSLDASPRTTGSRCSTRIAASADGSVRLASGEPLAALTAYRRAGGPVADARRAVRVARVRKGTGWLARALGDTVRAREIAFDAAREAFERWARGPLTSGAEAIGDAPPRLPAA
jgi:hypothetical protein